VKRGISHGAFSKKPDKKLSGIFDLYQLIDFIYYKISKCGVSSFSVRPSFNPPNTYKPASSLLVKRCLCKCYTFKVFKKLSATALSQQFPFWLMLFSTLE